MTGYRSGKTSPCTSLFLILFSLSLFRLSFDFPLVVMVPATKPDAFGKNFIHDPMVPFSAKTGTINLGRTKTTGMEMNEP